MRLEFLVLVVTIFFAVNHYFNGHYVSLLLSYKRHYQSIGILLAGIFFCWLIRYRPQRAKQMILDGQEYLSELPLDAQSKSLLNPVWDFSRKWGRKFDSGNPAYPDRKVIPVAGGRNKYGVVPEKRRVSETVKKFVASRAAWKCELCRDTVDSTYEIDHTLSLSQGGTNDMSNLRLLCRKCHILKTAQERSSI